MACKFNYSIPQDNFSIKIEITCAASIQSGVLIRKVSFDVPDVHVVFTVHNSLCLLLC